MLQYFPTPYPDELWYSVLCRYQIRSGNTNMLLTRNRDDTFLLFPNRSIHETVKLLPEGVFDTKELIVNHTLFPYFCRMRPLDEKMKMVDALSEGEVVEPGWKTNAKTSTMLRYCPICKKEEQEIYGESYWHREHQIPLLTVCPKHRCKLVEHNGRGQWNVSLFLPEFIAADTEPDLKVERYEVELSSMLYRYVSASFELGPTDGYSNLLLELEKRYRKIRGSRIAMLDTERLYADLMEFYGEYITKACFGKRMPHNLSMKLRSWNFPAPERYAVLAALIGQEAEVTFGDSIEAGSFEKQLYGIADKRTRYNRRKTA